MKRKNRIKKTASNPFSRHTGIKTIQLSGSTDCIVVQQKTIKIVKDGRSYPTSKAAVRIYRKIDISDIKKVTHSCGIDQCVHPDHLEVTLIKSAQEGYNASTEGWGV